MATEQLMPTLGIWPFFAWEYSGKPHQARGRCCAGPHYLQGTDITIFNHQGRHSSPDTLVSWRFAGEARSGRMLGMGKVRIQEAIAYIPGDGFLRREVYTMLFKALAK